MRGHDVLEADNKEKEKTVKFNAMALAVAAVTAGLGACTNTSPNGDPGASQPPSSPSPTVSEIARGDCSAGDAEVGPYAGELPEAVALTRTEIIEATIACDYERLEEIALAEGEGFSYSFGVEKSPASFWRARERDAKRLDLPTSEYMRYLVSVLQLPHCVESSDDGTGTNTEVVYYVWPRVHCAARSDADWDDLAGLYPEDRIKQMRAHDIYLGHRVGIREDGDWEYFIAGD